MRRVRPNTLSIRRRETLPLNSTQFRCDTKAYLNAGASLAPWLIIDAFPGLKVSIESNGKCLDEYPSTTSEWTSKYPVSEYMRCSTYVECATDAEFKIKYESTQVQAADPVGNALIAWADVDGEPTVAGMALLKQDIPRNGPSVIRCHGRKTGVSPTHVAMHPFKFSAIQKGTSSFAAPACA